jgi:hypothetical protein
MGAWHQDGLADWLSVVMWHWLWARLIQLRVTIVRIEKLVAESGESSAMSAVGSRYLETACEERREFMFQWFLERLTDRGICSYECVRPMKEITKPNLAYALSRDSVFGSNFFLLERPNLFATCNNTFSKWWEGWRMACRRVLSSTTKWKRNSVRTSRESHKVTTIYIYIFFC